MKKLIPKCQKAWTALTYKLNNPPPINQDGSSEKQNRAYTLPNYTNTGREVSIYGNPIKEEPVDATRTTPQYNKTLTEYDSARLTDAYDEVLRQQAHSIYGGLRFTPYVKYATDFADAFGLSPDQNGERDFTDASVWGKYGFNTLANRQTDLFNLRAQYARQGMIYDPKFTLWNKATGRIKTPLGMMSTVRDPNIMNTAAQIFTGNAQSMTKAVKYNPLGVINVIGDAIQLSKNIRNWYNADKRAEALADSLYSLPKYQPRLLPNGEVIMPQIDTTHLERLSWPFIESSTPPRAQLKRQHK